MKTMTSLTKHQPVHTRQQRVQKMKRLLLAICVVLWPLSVSNCGYIYLMGYTRSIQQGKWEWGEIEPGSILRCSRDLHEGVFASGRGRLYMPFGNAETVDPRSIQRGEILRVIRLEEGSTGTHSNHRLMTLDEAGKPIVFSLPAVNPEDGSSFTKKGLTRIGFEIVNQ